MIVKKIARFSDFIGKPFVNKEDTRLAPTLGDITTTYNRAKKILDNLKDKTYDYVSYNMKKFGEKKEKLFIIETKLHKFIYKKNSGEITITNMDSGYIYTWDETSIEVQIEFCEMLEDYISDKEPRTMLEVK